MGGTRRKTGAGGGEGGGTGLGNRGGGGEGGWSDRTIENDERIRNDAIFDTSILAADRLFVAMDVKTWAALFLAVLVSLSADSVFAQDCRAVRQNFVTIYCFCTRGPP